MILQTKSDTLAALMATDGGKCPHLTAIRDAILIARAEAEVPIIPENVVNDRTTLKHQKQK